MFKKLMIFLMFFLFSFSFLTLTNKTVKTKNEDFYTDIKEFKSYNSNLTNQYYEQYQKNKNIILALNTVNYPRFLSDHESSNYYLVNKPLLVNRKYRINTIKKNLVPVDNCQYIKRKEDMKICDIALQKYVELYKEMVNNGLDVVVYSSFRTIEYQTQIYNRGIFENELSLIAKPLYSEHHTGLAIDLSTNELGLTSHFEKSKEFIFLKENAHKYGFILRYPKDKTKITGYDYEPWHYRYVGKEIATICYMEKLCLEEYYYNYIEIITAPAQN